MLALVIEVESQKLTGPEKKKVVISRLAQWFDDALKLPWYLEPFDKAVAKFVLTAVYWVIGGWLESVFQRWKAKLPEAAQADLAESFAEVTAPISKKKGSKDAAKP
jgi:hypothetical protein